MFRLEDTIKDNLIELYKYLPDYLENYEKCLIIKNTEKYGYLISNKLNLNEKYKLPNLEKLIICKNFMGCIFATNCILLKNNKSLKYQNIVLKEVYNRLFEYIITNKNPDIDIKNFLKLTKTILNDLQINIQNHYFFSIFDNLIIIICRFLYRRNLQQYKYDKQDIIFVKLGKDILLNDIEYFENLFFLKLFDIRINYIKKLGYITPLMHLIENPDLPANEYQIFVRGKQVAKGTFEYDSPQSIDDIFNHLEKVIIQYVHQIFSIRDTYRYLEYVKKEHSAKIVKDLLKQLDIEDIKTVFCNLIQKEISIKDLPFVVENLAIFAKYDKDTDSLTEKMKEALICSR